MSVSNEIPVVPFAVDRSIVKVNVSLDSFQLNALDGTASVYQYDENDVLIKIDSVPIPSSIWTTWQADDFYIIDFVLDSLGLSRVV